MKNSLIVTGVILFAFLASFGVGWGFHSDDPVMANVVANRTFVGIFFAAWLYRILDKAAKESEDEEDE